MEENMRLSMIRNIIISFGRVVGLSDDECENYIKEYAIMSDKDVISALCNLVFDHFKEDEEMLDYFLDFINNINPDISKGIDYMKEHIIVTESENDSLNENHQYLEEIIEYFTLVFNESKIDYYLTGSLAGFTRKKVPLFRNYDSLDILVNESDLNTVSELISNSGYAFYDDRFISYDRYLEVQSNPTHSTVSAVSPDNSFHVNIKTFRREKDNSITTLDYIHIPGDNNVRVDVIERIATPYSTSLQYDDSEVEYGESSFRTASIEAIYDSISTKTDDESKLDCRLLEPFVNQDNLKELRRNVNHKNVVKDVKKDEIKL